MNNIDTETLQQLVEGTTDMDIVRGLCYGVLETLNEGSHEISYRLFEGELNAAGLLDILHGVINFVEHNLVILKKEVTEFDSLCEEVRSNNEN